MTANPLIGYAFLKVNFQDEVGDLLDLTLPLTRRALHQWPQKVITPDALQQRVYDVWGMDIPQYVLRSLLRKLSTQGVLYFDQTEKSYRINSVMVGAHDVIEKEKQAQAIYNRVSSKIRNELIREGIKNLDAKTIIESFLDGSALSFISNSKPAGPLTDIDQKSARIIARIIGISTENYDESFLQDIQDIIIGDILYKAICAVSDGDTFDPVSCRMSDVMVFLDTGVLFRALGYFGERLAGPAREMIEILKVTGCKICTFEHNVEEIVEGLNAVASRLYSGGAYGPILSFVSENGLGQTDILELAADVPQTIIREEISIRPLPERTAELGINESELDFRVEMDVKQNNVLARQRDVDALAAIYRLRDGKPQNKLEICKAIFVTSNRSLADSSTKFFQAMFRKDGKRNIVQLCMTDVVLTTRLWLKVPTKFGNVPRSQILAHAHSSLRPSAEVMSRFLEIIRERVQAKQLAPDVAIVLSFSNVVKGVLTLESDNDARRINAEIVDDVIAKGITITRANIARVRSEATAQGALAASIDAQRAIKSLQDNLEESFSISLKAQNERDTLREAVDGLNREIEALKATRIVSEALTRWTVNICIPVCWVILICGILIPILTIALPKLANWWELQISGGIISLFLSLLTIVGIGFRDVRANLERWIFSCWESIFDNLTKTPRPSNKRREPTNKL